MPQQVLHLLCSGGTCRLHFSGREHTLRRGHLMIAVASHVGGLEPSPDCRLRQLMLPAEQQASLMPTGSYGACGWLHLFMHPIFMLDEAMLRLIEHDFDEVEYRSKETPERHREEAVMQAMRMLYLDAMSAHAALYEREEATQRAAVLMSRFIQMLEAGAYRRQRAVAYYAEELCVTAKHLHKVSTQVSGRTPSYWIQQFTVMEIRHLMMHRRLQTKDIADRLGFDSVSHLNRYIAHFGKS